MKNNPNHRTDRISRLLRKDEWSDSEVNEIWLDWQMGMEKFASIRLSSLPIVRYGCSISTSDVLQEVFVKAWRAWGNAREDANRASFLAYSNAVVITYLQDRVRYANRQRRSNGKVVCQLEVEIEMDDQAVKELEQIDWLEATLSKLRKEDELLATVAHSRFLLDISVAEIAEQIGKSRRTVSDMVRKAAKWFDSQDR